MPVRPEHHQAASRGGADRTTGIFDTGRAREKISMRQVSADCMRTLLGKAGAFKRAVLHASHLASFRTGVTSRVRTQADLLQVFDRPSRDRP